MCNVINRRQMHPRNIFRSPPDYTDLAIKYKSFREVCKLNLCGKVAINYKEERTLRVLTRILLQEYFQLNVDFAPGSLVPTLPLRLNYILWIEDLIIGMDLTTREIMGIDIGCGSSCIYSLIAAKKNAWHMFALESNSINFTYAQHNISTNNLEHLVKVISQKDKSVIFRDLFRVELADSDSTAFSFCLCNPPFFDSSLQNPFDSTTRNPTKRAQPHNCHTGHAEELSCLGGEVQFVERIIEESVVYQQHISLFTSMIGHKRSLTRILDSLQSHGIFNFSTTEFCQGNTTRWGVAWSFSQDFDLNKIPNLT